MAVTSTLSFSVRAYEAGTGDLAIPTANHLLPFYREMTSGVTANKHDLVWSDSRTITGNVDLDLSGGLTSALGAVLTPAKLVGLYIRNKSTVSGEKIILGNEGVNPFYVGLFNAATDTAVIQPSGLFAWDSPIDGATITAGTGDILRLAAGAANIPIDILMLFRSI